MKAWFRLGNRNLWAFEARRESLQEVIPDASLAPLYHIIERKIILDSIVYSDCWRGYNVLDV